MSASDQGVRTERPEDIRAVPVRRPGRWIVAIIVLVVAACEVTVGLGLIVAIYRRRMAVNVDELHELRG